MPLRLDDTRVRVAAFRWLQQQVDQHGDVLPRTLLQHGFELDGERIPLVSRQGIFKPKVLSEMPLSITTTVHGPYDDKMSADGLMLYSYRGDNPAHSENAGLRKAMVRGTPLVYFHSIAPNKYLAVWPVVVVGDDPGSLTFTVAVDDPAYLKAYAATLSSDESVHEPAALGRRQYITSLVLHRLHQRGFRERVLEAYMQRCALCRLRHAELLDAAHIIPDGEPGGEPVITNGIALCKLHHAAFDSFFLGITPGYNVEVRPDILEEHDGPMLTHALQGLHKARIILPKQARFHPSPEKLEVRYGRFKLAARG
jgi:putative restriction endonuclease